MLTVCICTHNPKSALLARVIDAIAAQTDTRFDVMLIDNASSPPVDEAVLMPLNERGLAARILREPSPGLVRARLRAIGELRSDWMLCVDDDNILAPGYVAEGLSFITANPDVGAFGGKLVLPAGAAPPVWSAPFLPFLAVRDIGDAVKKGISPTWAEWEPPAAGAFVSSAMLRDFAHFVSEHPDALHLGRSPGSSASCEDSLLMHSAFALGLATAYNPRLSLTHCISRDRFRFARLISLMEGYGSSHVLLEWLLQGPQPTPKYYSTPAHVALTLVVAAIRNFLPSPAFAYARVCYHLAAARTYRDLQARISPPISA